MKSLLLFLGLMLQMPVWAQDCTVARYRQLMREAERAAFGTQPNYQLAVNKLLSAQTCQPDSQAVVSAQLVRVFDEVNRQRESAVKNEKEANKQRALAVKNEKEAKKQTEKAEAEARRIYANDLAFKSELALKNGDRTTAYRLAEFAHRYVDRGNEQVTQALFNALYYNDNPNHTPLPWASNLEGHNSSVICVSFSPDGTRLATGSADNCVKIWDLRTGNNVLTIEQSNVQISCIAFSQDGNQFATGSEDNSIQVWDLQSRKITHTLAGHRGGITCIAFSPDGTQLATGAYDNTAKIWNLPSGKNTQTFEGHTAWAISVAFSPDGMQLATGSSDNTAKIWSLLSGKNTLTLEGHQSWIQCVAFSPNGTLLATSSEDNTAKIWNLQSGKNTQTLEGHQNSIRCVAFSPDGTQLATGSLDNTTKIWNLKSGKNTQTLEGHQNSIRCVAFSPDGTQLATGSLDNTIKIWDLQPGTNKQTFAGHQNWVVGVAFSPDGTQLATGSRDGTAKIWDCKSGKNIQTLEGHQSPVSSVAFSPDGTQLATGSHDNTVKIWNLLSGKNTQTLEGHINAVNSIAFSPDGTQLATGSSDYTAKIWDLQTGKNTQTIEGHQRYVTSVAFSPDGTLLATGSHDNTVKIWNLQTGKNTQIFETDNEYILSIAFSPDGTQLATGLGNHTAKIWNLQSGKNTQTFKGHTLAVNCVAFSPDGTLLATGSDDQTVKIWNLQSDKNTLTIQGHSSSISGVAFSPDGSQLATGSGDDTAKIWEISADGCLGVPLNQPCLAGLTLPQLDAYGFDNLLSQQPGNEAQLVASGNVWQIAAFADLYAQKTRNSKILERTAPHYLRATRLYQAAAEVSRDSVFFVRLGALNYEWASTILESARPDTARWYIEQACLLHPDKSVCPELWQRLSKKTGRAFEVQRFLEAKSASILRGYGDYFFKSEQWAEARQLYEKAEAKQHETKTLLNLFRIAETAGQSFNFQRFLEFEDATELNAYGDFFFEKAQWTEAQQLYQKGETKQHKTQTLINLCSIAETTGQLFDFQRFLESEDATELNAYGDFFYQKKQWSSAQQLYEKAERKEHRAATQVNLFRIAEKTNQVIDFQGFLKSENAYDLAQYANYFAALGRKSTANKDRTLNYQRALQLRERQMQLDTGATLRVLVANEYNSLAFYQLFSADGQGAAASLQRAEALDPNNVLIATNRAPALLLQGQEAAAQAEYQKWKDQPLNQQDYATYRDAFLADLQELEAAGVPGIDYAKVRQWLE